MRPYEIRMKLLEEATAVIEEKLESCIRYFRNSTTIVNLSGTLTAMGLPMSSINNALIRHVCQAKGYTISARTGNRTFPPVTITPPLRASRPPGAHPKGRASMPLAEGVTWEACMEPAVYAIRNKVNGKKFIAFSTYPLTQRVVYWHHLQHADHLSEGNPFFCSPSVAEDVKTYGHEVFELELLETAPGATITELHLLKKKHLEATPPHLLYNTSKKGLSIGTKRLADLSPRLASAYDQRDRLEKEIAALAAQYKELIAERNQLLVLDHRMFPKRGVLLKHVTGKLAEIRDLRMHLETSELKSLVVAIKTIKAEITEELKQAYRSKRGLS